MLKTFQIIALLQGIFLIIILLNNYKKNSKPTFWLLIGCITSVILYILGDDDNSLFHKNLDLFFFDKSLFITFLFLFVKYQITNLEKFNKKDLLYFIPNLIYFFIEIIESIYKERLIIIDFPELVVETIFLFYLIYIFYLVFKNKTQKWLLYFIFPLVITVGVAIVNEILYWFHTKNIIFLNDTHFGSYTIVVIAFLFYMIAIKLTLNPKDLILNKEKEKYQSSTLNSNQILNYKASLIELMEKEKMFKDQNLSLVKISEHLQIPRQYISEILNVHMETNFQDFLNSYRIEAFIKCLKSEEYKHYNLLGIAKEVGFNSKATFNATFKKIKGMTPSEFKKNIK